MKLLARLGIGSLLLGLTSAQCAFTQDTCWAGFESGTDEVIYTVPYTYDQVMSIIGSYKNLTWSGNPDNTVTLDGPDNTVGTTRTYDLAGAHVIEKILTYSKPPAPGPYNEVHNTALLQVPAANVSVYIIYDGTVVSSICDGRASTFNFTAHFCATNATTAGPLLHMLHMNDAVTVGQFLGGMNFTSCDALGSSGGGSGSSSTSTPAYATASSTASGSASAPVATYTGAAQKNEATMLGFVAAIAAAVFW